MSEPVAQFGEMDRFLFNEGTHRRVDGFLGAHPDTNGTWFRVWAPNARRVEVVGDFNGWSSSDLEGDNSGVWSGYITGARPGQAYRYAVTAGNGSRTERTDPVAAANHVPPSVASIIWESDHVWNDDAWLTERAAVHPADRAMSIYEVHLGSWGRTVSEGQRFPNYRQLGIALAEHVESHGFTHVELMPVTEHPFYGSWGYQTTGYFAPTARYGTPDDFAAMIDHLHQRGIGVIVDWVPSHFPMDAHGLSQFDGTHLFEHDDPRLGYHPDWTSAIFNYGRNEVRAFLISSAMSWIERYHADGIRVDAVASMLYRDYSRAAGEWLPNQYGGRENLEAIDFLRQFNDAVHAEHPDVITVAEESTAWPQVTGSTEHGGLGFDFKWDMGWMHDTLLFMRRDPVHRRYHHDELTFRSVYAYSERFILPLSHDEVVHGKGSLLGKMPGDEWRRAANLRLLFVDMWVQPGKKLLFMGAELGVPREWSHDGTLDWSLHDAPVHRGFRRLLADLNDVYRNEPAMHLGDAHSDGFRWVIGDDEVHSVFAFLRLDPAGHERPVLVVLNFTPTVHHGYRVGVPRGGAWYELLNSDSTDYDGSGMGNLGGVEADETPSHGYDTSLSLTIPPLGGLLLSPADWSPPDG